MGRDVESTVFIVEMAAMSFIALLSGLFLALG